MMATLKQRLITLEASRPAKVKSDYVFWTDEDRAVVQACWKKSGEPNTMPASPRPYDPSMTAVQNELYDTLVFALSQI